MVLFLVILGLIILVAYTEFVIIRKLYNKFFGRYDKPEFTRFITHKDINGYSYKTVHFRSDTALLTGYLYDVENSKGLIVIAHGLSGGAETYLSQIMYFVDKGWKVFSYDCTGSFNSEGINTVGLVQSVLDLKAALYFVHSSSELNSLPIMLYGHSWGGYAVTAILNQAQGIKACVSVSAYNSPNELLANIFMKLTEKSWIRIFAYISKPFVYVYHKIIFRNNATITAIDGINKSNIACMIIHGKKDEIVDIGEASIIAKKQQIANKKVLYEIRERGHFDIFRTENASEYKRKLDLEYKQLEDNNKNNIPYQILVNYYSKIDRYKYCELDIEHMDKIHAFYLANL